MYALSVIGNSVTVKSSRRGVGAAFGLFDYDTVVVEVVLYAAVVTGALCNAVVTDCQSFICPFAVRASEVVGSQFSLIVCTDNESAQPHLEVAPLFGSQGIRLLVQQYRCAFKSDADKLAVVADDVEQLGVLGADKVASHDVFL